MFETMKTPNRGAWFSASLTVCLLLACSAFAGLKPFPLSANQRGTVACLESPAISYDAYLPRAYSTNGAALPILYTLSPGGGGMVSDFKTVCSNLNIIAVGIVGSKNGVPWDTEFKEFYAVSRDIRQRVLFDPSAEFVGGFSGGGECSYFFSRMRAQHVAGVLAMGGWLGRTSVSAYTTTDRVQANLLVARTTGTTDTGGNYYLVPDSNYLASCGAVIQDWFFTGGHSVAPDSIKTSSLTWLLNQRVAPGPDDQSSALTQAADWRSRIAAGQAGTVLRECVITLMTGPRTWSALQAELVMDDLMANYSSFRTLEIDNLAQGDFASDLFYYIARGAGNAGDVPRRWSALKALTGVTGASGDRAGDVYSLLAQYGYPAPVLQLSVSQPAGQANLRLRKDTPGLTYSLQSRSNLVNSVWLAVSLPVLETNTTWSAGFDFPPGSGRAFYRMSTAPSPATSPPWP